MVQALPPGGKVYSDEEDKLVKTMMQEKATYAQVAAALGRSRSSVASYITRHSIPSAWARGFPGTLRNGGRLKPKGISAKTYTNNGGASIIVHRMRARLLAPVIEEVTETDNTSVTLLNAKEHHCRWPLGDPRFSTFRFCGVDKKSGSSYCCQHAEKSKPQPFLGSAVTPPKQFKRF